jgi:hypothetical protein
VTKKRSHSDNSELCQFPFADGRRCRMLRHHHPSLCVFHANDELQLLESRRLGAEVSATLTGHFITTTDITHILGKVFTAYAQDRIPQRKAATLGYLGQVMLTHMPRVSHETQIGYSFDGWRKLLANGIYPAGSWPAQPTLPAARSATPPPPTSVRSPQRLDGAADAAPQFVADSAPQPTQAQTNSATIKPE